MDEKTHYFKAGFDALSLQVRERYYTSVSDFSQQLSSTIAKRLSPDEDADGNIDAIHTQLNESKGTAEHHALSQEQKEIKKLAKRILKAIKEPLADAMRKEAELKGKELEEEIRKLDSMGMFATAKSLGLDDSPIKTNGKRRSASDASAEAGASPEDEDIEMEEADEAPDESIIHLKINSNKKSLPNRKKSTPSSSTSSSHGSHHATRNSSTTDTKPPTEPLSPPISTSSASASAPDTADVFASGGIPWYLTPFDPEGTTVHEERYTGRAVLREMSEELSDMDEDTLTELGGKGVGEGGLGGKTRTRGSSRAAGEVAGAAPSRSGGAGGGESVKGEKGKAKKRVRSNQWSRPRRIR